jgi:hypothetical protein
MPFGEGALVGTGLVRCIRQFRTRCRVGRIGLRREQRCVVVARSRQRSIAVVERGSARLSAPLLFPAALGGLGLRGFLKRVLT